MSQQTLPKDHQVKTLTDNRPPYQIDNGFFWIDSSCGALPFVPNSVILLMLSKPFSISKKHRHVASVGPNRPINHISRYW
jgi:hypothetical protein